MNIERVQVEFVTARGQWMLTLAAGRDTVKFLLGKELPGSAIDNGHVAWANRPLLQWLQGLGASFRVTPRKRRDSGAHV